MDEQPRASGAHLAGVVEDRECDGARCLVEVSVREDHVRRLAAELWPHPLEIRLGGILHEFAPDRGRAGERHDIDIHVASERLPCNVTEAVHDVEDSVGDAGLQREPGKEKCRERGRLCRLEDDGAAGRQRWGDLPDRHREREVPGHDRRHDPRGLALDEREGIARGVRDLVEDLVDRLAEPPKGADDCTVVDRLRLAGRLAHLECLKHGEFVGVRRAELRPPDEDLLALERRLMRPAAVLEGAPR